jgi:hypothetical protein
VVIFITLLAGFVPLLQVTFIALLEDLSIWFTRCERSGQNSRIIALILYHVVSEHQVDHRECFLLIADYRIGELIFLWWIFLISLILMLWNSWYSSSAASQERVGGFQIR